MREYGQIQSSYWTHPDIQPLSVEAKVIGAYLLTCQHTNGIGCFRIPIGYVSIDLGMGIETVSKGFRELSENGFLEHDPRSEYVLIPQFLRWNKISNPNSAKARISEFDLVPSSVSIYPKLINALLRHGKYWGDEFLNRLEALSKGFRKGSERVPADLPDNQTQPLPLPEPKTEDAIASLSPEAGDDHETGPPDSRPPVNHICPAQKIADLYNRNCPKLPPAKLDAWSDANRKHLRSRWRWLMAQPIKGDPDGRKYADDHEAALAWFERFFRYVDNRCPHLNGENDRGWTANLIWLIQAGNFAKVIEGHYEPKVPRAAP